MPSSACQKCADRKSTRLNSSHTLISYAVFCLKNKRVLDRKSTRLNSSHTLISYAVFCLKIKSAEAIGAVWNDNTYPGAACDVPSLLYGFSLVFFLRIRGPPASPLFPHTTLFE